MFFAQPSAKWTLCQRTVVVLALARNFETDPIRQLDALIFVAQFDFSNDQTGICSSEHIDFPTRLSARNEMPYLLDDGTLPQLNECLRLEDRNGIFKLESTKTSSARFDGQRGSALVPDADSNRCFAIGGQIGLPYCDTPGCEFFPTVCFKKKFTLNLETHTRPFPRIGRPTATCHQWSTQGN